MASPIINRLISGGQTGADKAGLLSARNLGIPTGGTAPKGWRICLPDGSDGQDLELLNIYGLIEHSSRDYPPRTKQNVIDSDGTVWVGFEGSPGGKLTINTCKKLGKPCIVNPTAEELRAWIVRENIKVLNVSGNRVSELNPNISNETYDLIFSALCPPDEGWKEI